MRWGLRSKLVLVTACLIAAALISADLFLSRALDRDLTRRVRSDLARRLDLIEGWVAAHPPPEGDLPSWDQLADQLGDRAAARVSLIAADGRVLGDSGVALADMPGVENHIGREEVVAALARGGGSAVRVSATVDRAMLYLARRTTIQGGATVVVRAALPLTEVEQALARLHWLLLGGSLLAVVVAVLLSILTARMIGRSLQSIAAAARQIAQGNLDVRIRPETRDEIGQLAATLDQLADSLSATLRALRDERDRLGRILEAMEEGILVVGNDRAILMANPAARVLLLSAAQSSTDAEARRTHAGAPLEGRSLLQAVRSADLDAIVDQTLQAQQPASGEVAIDRPRARRLLVHAAPLGGQSPGAVVVLVDVTEIRRLEAVRKDFVANVSHELRTPLTAVRTAVETARVTLGQDPREADRFLAIADRHAERLTALVRDLLDLSRVESGHLALEMGPVSAPEIVAEVLALFREAASRRRIGLSSDLPADLPLVTADWEALTQVVTNLVENAVKYCDEGGTVTVAAHRQVDDSDTVHLQVKDSGPGIAAKHLPRLFERFYRVDPGRSRERGGTGLGLSIVKHLCEAMGATVSVESQPGRGSTFTVKLPVAAAA
jgi:two-component system, OmpR family, phosphate regulon sensor histidine kinase PhoR